MREKGRSLKVQLQTHKYIFLMLYVPLYAAAFFAVELLIPETADYWVSYCFIDDWIPFCEYFIIPYYLWYPFLFTVGIYLLIEDVPVYKLYMCYVIVGFTASILICVAFPNGQDLRPEVFPRDNLLTDLVKMIYAVDTNTNVLPSVHAVGGIFAALAICQTKTISKKWIKVSAVAIAALISISTCFVKQHSILDVLAAIGLCFLIYIAFRILMAYKSKNAE